MKKVQVSTVRQTADVEVIYVSANLISKTIKADNVLTKLLGEAHQYGAINEEYKVDEDGNPLHDEDGKMIPNIVDGKQVVIYNDIHLMASDLQELAEIVAPFLTELVEAFEA